MNVYNKCFVNVLLPLSYNNKEIIPTLGENSYWYPRKNKNSLVKKGCDMPKTLDEAISVMKNDNLLLGHEFLVSCKKLGFSDENFVQEAEPESENLEGYNYPLY